MGNGDIKGHVEGEIIKKVGDDHSTPALHS